ncbi:MAG TPA: hypothetical protein ENJ88_00295 [Phaeodactylibacter sp.]|nr:hypothetical protein [Phaeodactylibacter sp.]
MNKRCKTNKWVFLLALLAGLWGCRQTPEEDKGKLLARVGDHALYMSDLEGMIPTQMSWEDSSLIINSFVEHWVRDMVVLQEAERNRPRDLDIDKLVEDYRASLLRDNFERMLIASELDTVVTRKQLEDYYRNKKENYPLKTDLLRAYLIVLPGDAPNRKEEFEKLWKQPEANYDAILAYCEDYSPSYLLKDSSWYAPADLVKSWGTLSLSANDFLSQARFHKERGGMHYYFYRLEKLKKGEPAPLNYVKDQIRELILHRRKTALLRKLEEEMYEKALRDKEVKIFIE